MAKRMIFALAILGVLLVCGIGYAYTPDIIGLNVRSAAMAGAFTALAEGPAAAFYNPAALALRDEIQMEAGFMYTLGAFDLDRKSEDGELLENTDELDDALETNGVQYLGLGVSGRIYDYVGLGVFFNVPVDGRPHDKFFPPDTPYWLRYENSLQGYQIFPAVAVKIRPNICVGLGIGVIADMGGDIDTRVPLTGGDTEVVSMGKSKTAANAALNAGVFYRPLEWLRVGFSYRGANYIKHEKTLNVKLLYGDASLPVDIDVKTDYSPQQMALGAAGIPLEWMTVSLDLVYTFWSQYEPPFPDIDVDYASLEDQDLLPFEQEILEVEDPNFADTMVARLGLEFRPIKHFNVMGGFSYEPTPVPDQDGTTNIIDADTVVASLGFGVNFGGPEGDLIRVDAGMQYHFIADRDFEKDLSEMDETNPYSNPGYPTFSMKSDYFVGGLTAKFAF